MKHQTPHCESCGVENPGTHDGYTVCCNELVCDGNAEHKFGTPKEFVISCCWSKAEDEFAKFHTSPPADSSRF